MSLIATIHICRKGDDIQLHERRHLLELAEHNEDMLWQKLCVFSSNQKQNQGQGEASRNPAIDLLVWFLDHAEHPFPSPDDMIQLVNKTGLNRVQVSNWFTNTRKVIACCSDSSIMFVQSLWT
jgi:hypothetical protein